MSETFDVCHQAVGWRASRFISRNEVSNHQGTKVHYFISRGILEHFFELDDLEQKLKGIAISKLPQWEKFAIEETLKRIDEKKRGIQEAEYPGWSG
ncbi:MAG TPA: hypothetical protein VN578_07960 [Candidatus Binatia bacterium]|nr:hypothetical protein [Candidatus Binatia bacterium]